MKYLTFSLLRVKKAHTLISLLIRDIQLLTASPMDYLYIYLTPKKKQVTIYPFSKTLKRIGQRYLRELQVAVPEVSVMLIGSLMLELPGAKDIDLFIACDPKHFDQYEPRITRILGEPSKKKRTHIEWILRMNDYTVELIMADQTKKRFLDQQRICEIMKDNPLLREQYKQVKLQTMGLSLRDSKRARMLFFNKTLRQEPIHTVQYDKNPTTGQGFCRLIRNELLHRVHISLVEN